MQIQSSLPSCQLLWAKRVWQAACQAAFWRRRRIDRRVCWRYCRVVFSRAACCTAPGVGGAPCGAGEVVMDCPVARQESGRGLLCCMASEEEAAAEAGKAGSAFCSRAAAGRSCCWEWRLLLHCCPSLHSLLHSGRFAAHPPVVLHGVLQARTWKARQCEVDDITTFRDFLL